MEYIGNQHKRLYGIWNAMKQRCYYPQKQGYQYYGGRGIQVCEEWKDSFSNFAEWAFQNGYDENAKPYECTLYRIDYNGNYCPENCRFIKWSFTKAIETPIRKSGKYKGKTD